MTQTRTPAETLAEAPAEKAPAAAAPQAPAAEPACASFCGASPNPAEAPDSTLERASVVFNRILTYGQAAALIGIALAAVAGIGQQIASMIGAGKVELGELLMLFLYVEIISMVKGAVLGTREIPIHTPIALAIVAVSRYLVVDVEHINPDYMLFTSASILVLVLSLWVVQRLCQRGKEPVLFSLKALKDLADRRR